MNIESERGGCLAKTSDTSTSHVIANNSVAILAPSPAQLVAEAAFSASHDLASISTSTGGLIRTPLINPQRSPTAAIAASGSEGNCDVHIDNPHASSSGNVVSQNSAVSMSQILLPQVDGSPRFVKRRSKVTREGVPDFEGKALTRAWGTISVVSDLAYQQTAGSVSSTASNYSHSPPRHYKQDDAVLQPQPRRAAPEFGVYAICGHRSTMEDSHLAIPNIAENAFFPKRVTQATEASAATSGLAKDMRGTPTDIPILKSSSKDELRQERASGDSLPLCTSDVTVKVAIVPNPPSPSLMFSSPVSPSVSDGANAGPSPGPLQSPYPPSRVRSRLLSGVSNASVFSSFSQNSIASGALGIPAATNESSLQASGSGSRGSSRSSMTPTTSRKLPQPNPQNLATVGSVQIGTLAQAQTPNQSFYHDSAGVTDQNAGASARDFSRGGSSGSRCGSIDRRTLSAGRSRITAESPAQTVVQYPMYANCRGFFCVCDGHGGAQCSEWVSDNLAPILFTHPEFNTNVVTAVHDTFAEVEKRWLERSKAEDIDSGTTVLTALLQNNQLIVSNVGDSEAVLCRGGTAMSVSVAHNLKSNDNERKRLEELDARIYKQRLGHPALSERYFSIAVTRAIGDILYKDDEFTMGKPSGLIATPETQVIQLEKDDQFLILACDGLWDVMSHQEACNLVLRAKERLKEEGLETDWKFLAKMLATRAVKQGSTDNITVLIINLDGSSENGNAYNIGPNPISLPPQDMSSTRPRSKSKHQKSTRKIRTVSAASSGNVQELENQSAPSGRPLDSLTINPDFQHSDEGELDDVMGGSALDSLNSTSSRSKLSPRSHQRSATSFVGLRPASGPLSKVSGSPVGFVYDSSPHSSIASVIDNYQTQIHNQSGHFNSGKMGSKPPHSYGTLNRIELKGLNMRSVSNASIESSSSSYEASRDDDDATKVLGPLLTNPSSLSTFTNTSTADQDILKYPTHQRSSTLSNVLHQSHPDDEHLASPEFEAVLQDLSVKKGSGVTSEGWTKGDSSLSSYLQQNRDPRSSNFGTKSPSSFADATRLHIDISQVPSSDIRIKSSPKKTYPESTDRDERILPDRDRPFGLSPIHSPVQASISGHSGGSAGADTQGKYDHSLQNNAQHSQFLLLPQEAVDTAVGSIYSGEGHAVQSPSENPAHVGCHLDTDDKQQEHNEALIPTPTASSLVSASTGGAESNFFGYDRMSSKLSLEQVNIQVASTSTMTMTERTLRESNLPVAKKYSKVAARKREQAYEWDFDDEVPCTQTQVNTEEDCLPPHVPPLTSTSDDMTSPGVNSTSPSHPPSSAAENGSSLTSMFSPSTASGSTPLMHMSASTTEEDRDTDEMDCETRRTADNENVKLGEDSIDHNYGQDEDQDEYCRLSQFTEQDVDHLDSIGSNEIATLCGMEELKDGRVDDFLGEEHHGDTIQGVRSYDYNSKNSKCISSLFVSHDEDEPAVVDTRADVDKKKVNEVSSSSSLVTARGGHDYSEAYVSFKRTHIIPQPAASSSAALITPNYLPSGGISAPPAASSAAAAAANEHEKDDDMSLSSRRCQTASIRSKDRILEDIMSEHFFTIKGPKIRNGRSNLLSLFEPSSDEGSKKESDGDSNSNQP